LKNTSKITLCGVFSALAVVFMLLGYFPYFTYSAPAVAGLFIMIPLLEIDKKYAFLSYLSSSVIVFFTCETEAKMLFILFFGYYPILKAVIEKLRKQLLEWIIKIISFNTAVAVCYFALKLLTDIKVDDFGILGKYGALIFLVLCNFAFVLYDIAISRVSNIYFVKLHPKILDILRH